MKRNKIWDLTPREMQIAETWANLGFNSRAAQDKLGLSMARVEHVIYEPRARKYIDHLKHVKSEISNTADITKRFMSPEWVMGETIKLYQGIPEMGDLSKTIKDDCMEFIASRPGDAGEMKDMLDELIKRIDENVRMFKSISDQKQSTLNMISKFQKEFGESINEDTMRIMTMTQDEIIIEAEKLTDDIKKIKEEDWRKK
ncbi:MAG: hypothetical protein WC375_07530 [Methanomassiliicoccales archaeon]|jgi:gas vesicle protein